MAGDCAYTNNHYANSGAFCPSKLWSDGDADAGKPPGRGPPAAARWTSNFEVIDGLLYRKKLERGFINYREVLDEDRRHEAISTFHRRRPGPRHLSLEETYKCVADNYWWDGMYFHIRDAVLGCPECQSQRIIKTEGGRGCVTKTMASQGADILNKLRSQREAGLFCDITLRTNNRSYSAHRAVLAAVSDHFQEIFTDMDSSMKADIDLTGFGEDSLLSLLDFSYSSTLCVRQEDLPEVITLARHLGMWLAVEACTALMKEQEQQLSPGKGPPCGGACHERRHLQRDRKKRADAEPEDRVTEGFSLMLDVSDESSEECPGRNLRGRARPQGRNCLPTSPTHRMKLMDFKSPSLKKAAIPRHVAANHRSRSYSPVRSPNTRLLRSSPGAAKKVRSLLPMPESPRRSRKPQSSARLPGTSRSRPRAKRSPVRVKQEVEEVGEDEQDYARAQEKYKLMTVLGLQRTALLPRPEDLIGWRQKKRLRKLKANNYSLTKRRKPRSVSPVLPYGSVTLSLPLCNPVNSHLLSKSVKGKPVGAAAAEQVKGRRPKKDPQRIPPSDRSMRSKGVLPDPFQSTSRAPFGGRQLRRSVREGDGAHFFAQPPARRKTNKPLAKIAVRIKSEPAELCISGFSRQSQSSRSLTPSSSPRTGAGDAGAAEPVRLLRYNRSRQAASAQLKRGSAKEVSRSRRKPREEGRKARGSQGPRGVADSRPRVRDSGPAGPPLVEQGTPPSIYNHPLYRVIKEEPADPVPVAGPFPDPPSPDLGKRQSKPPIKLLDSGFLFSFCRSAGGPMAGLKKEEESVDICLTRSVSQLGERFGGQESPHRALRARGPPGLPAIKREREERRVSQSRIPQPRANVVNHTLHQAKSAGSRVTRTMPKQQGKLLPLSSRNCATQDSVRRARLKQLRGPRSQAPKVPKASHACLQCAATYRDCDALIMHSLRHVEGKHWPCPLCSKTFFRLRNVRNHIRTHEPKLYKCRSCIVASS